jgi:hypothetical protein
VVGVLLLLIELVSHSWLSRSNAPPAVAAVTDLYPVEDHPEVGWALRPDATHRAVKTLASGGACYDVTYRTDSFRRRAVSQRHDPRWPHLILFGGSTTMGEGLPDEGTLQFFLGRLIHEHNVYNYAVHGYGPSQMLAQLESGALPGQVVSQHGGALYIMIPEHVSRVTGDTRAFWAYRGPHYETDGENGVVRSGSFTSGRPLTTAVYRGFLALRQQSSFLTLINLELPPRISEKALELTARVLIRSKQLYEAQFDGDFAVVLHPSWNLGHEPSAWARRWLLSRLRVAGVEVLDHSRPGPMSDDEKIHPTCDPHPNAALNEGLAAAIARDLNLGR